MAYSEVELRVRGTVQGVGFRPAVWRLATELSLSGGVLNDGAGVLIRLAGPDRVIAAFEARLRAEAPTLARIDAIERSVPTGAIDRTAFRIETSATGVVDTAIVPDAATCAACLTEIATPGARRFGYPFTNCTGCGPRLTIIEAAPYDRARTTMRGFAMCSSCRAEYADATDRRFHAQPIACPACGPRLSLSGIEGIPVDANDPVTAAAALMASGKILALKGLGGFHLACDATNETAIALLRERKRRPSKPFAVMMADLATVSRHCALDGAEAALLQSPAAPIVVLQAGGNALPQALAPGLSSIGVMLPNTPLHHLLMQALGRPAVMTSGNLSEEPQCIDGAQARSRLGTIADAVLDHDRPIAGAVDDSVVRVMAGRKVILRRARGYAPAPLRLPPGFEAAPEVLAMGGEQKAAFCLTMRGRAVLSHHLGDIEHALAFDAYRRALDRYRGLFDHAPRIIAVDQHPEYLSRKLGSDLAETDGLVLTEVQHHHAHIAACLAENDVRLDAGPVLGLALDGLGFGDDGTIWGGEILLAGYSSYRRIGALEAVAMPGGSRAVREPWRNTLAHILAATGWDGFEARVAGTALQRRLAAKPVAAIASMIRSETNAPLASSCGRLFDAVAGTLGIAFDRQSWEGEAAARLEALADPRPDAAPYPFERLRQADGIIRLSATPMWYSLLDDLQAGASAKRVATRFHHGFATSVASLVSTLLREHGVSIVALSGGCFQNGLLLELVRRDLEKDGAEVLIHANVPANDGGLAFGQAAVAAARSLQG